MKYRETCSTFSLKTRLAIAFAGLGVMLVIFSGFLMIEYHRIAVGSSEIAQRAHDQMSRTMEMQDSLTQITRLAAIGEIDGAEITHFRRLISQVNSLANDSEIHPVVDRIESNFNQFVDSIQSRKTGPAWNAVKKAYSDDVAAAVGGLAERNQSSIYALAESLRQEQTRALQVDLILVLVFLIALVLTGYRLIVHLTNPLMNMARFIEGVDVESEGPITVPSFGSAPEVVMVAQSYARLFERLRVYRALNLRRLLSEKRRAEIIAASISDGIVLLRDSEVMYSNSVGTAILDSRHPGSDSGPSSRGLRAVLSAVSQTIPVEFSVESEDGHRQYLIQAFPISHELIYQMGDQQTRDVAGEFQATTIVVAQDVTIVKESQDAKGHFLATLSHEVKTPVTSLVLATRMLLRSVDQLPNPTLRSLVKTCSDDVDRLRGLLDDLLTMTRFDSLTQKVQLQHTDLGKLVKHSIQSFQSQAKNREIELSIDILNDERRPVLISMDPPKIAWALSSLLTNALRHSPRGSRVATSLEVKPDWIEFRVRDSGSGIDKQRLDRIFDKFSSFYDIRVARSGSAGLGLSIAREIIQAHGGRIWAVSELGEGAEFGFALPFKQGNVFTPKGAISGTSSRSG